MFRYSGSSVKCKLLFLHCSFSQFAFFIFFNCAKNMDQEKMYDVIYERILIDNDDK
jgi:hypothetical protein